MVWHSYSVYALILQSQPKNSFWHDFRTSRPNVRFNDDNDP